jgi:hypothetical protein
VPDILFFEDEEETPRLPQEVEFIEVLVHPLPDGRRIVVQVTLTPFMEYPSFDVTLLRSDGTEERSLSVVGTMERTTALTLHLSRLDPAPEYIARVELIHAGQVLQMRQVSFTVPDRSTAT